MYSSSALTVFSILIDRLRKADGSAKFRNITKTYILGRKPSGEVVLSKFGEDVFLFHLHLYKMIQDNISSAQESGHLYSYNFVLLRQLLEIKKMMKDWRLRQVQNEKEALL